MSRRVGHRFSEVSYPALFYAIAGVSMSFAGFAGLYLALRPHDAAWKAYEVAQVNAIILYALTSLFGALLLLPLADLIGESLALRLMSAGLLVVVFYGHQVRAETSWTRWPRVRRRPLATCVDHRDGSVRAGRGRRSSAAAGEPRRADGGPVPTRPHHDPRHAGPRFRARGLAIRVERKADRESRRSAVEAR